ncbi:MAG: hypothetical protein QMD50_00070 [Patescibacteria group bacterium]|nr:hypothetical protein [Patescibacteria group bacterium]
MKIEKVKKPAIIFDFDGTLTQGTEQDKTLFIKAVRECDAKVIKKNINS